MICSKIHLQQTIGIQNVRRVLCHMRDCMKYSSLSVQINELQSVWKVISVQIYKKRDKSALIRTCIRDICGIIIVIMSISSKQRNFNVLHQDTIARETS